jgi:flagellar basal-body rod protein FlgF
MNIGMYQSAASMTALERWQDVVAQNITSGQVTGYKKKTVEVSTESAGGWQLDPNAKAGDVGVPAQFPIATTGVSYTSGETQPTGRDLDVAISGEGFLEFQAPDGTHVYGRSGELSIRPDHTLVNAANEPVLSDGGSPIMLQPDGKVTVNADGSIVQTTASGSTTVGRFAVQQFGNQSALQPAANGMFTAGPGAQPSAMANPQLMQGYLESSNVQPMREMVNLVQISRAYEANQHVITSADSNMQKSLDELG